jgi:hypothetical protein
VARTSSNSDTGRSVRRDVVEHLLTLTRAEEATAGDDAVNALRVADVCQRIGVEDEQISAFAAFDGSG